MASRAPIVLRDAEPEDAAALVQLWSDCLEEAPVEGGEAFAHQPLWRRPAVAEAAEALALHLSLPTKRIILALVEGEVVGAVVCDLGTVTPVTLDRILMVTELQVSPRHRRRNVAATLLSAAATYGEEHDCEVVVAAIPVQAKEPHRYLAKLGFTQVAAVRAVQASRLRSRLSTKATHSRDTGKLIAVRRTLRRRQGTRTAP